MSTTKAVKRVRTPKHESNGATPEDDFVATRLAELKAEREKGKLLIANLSARLESTQRQLERIAGAIFAFEEIAAKATEKQTV